MSSKFFIYKITNLINNKIYIGKSQHDLKCGSTRWQVHLKIARGGSEIYGRMFSYLHKSIRKHGAENFSYEIIEEVETESLALELESAWIAKLKASNHTLYNLTSGGEGMSGFTHSEESKKKISFAEQGEKSSRAKLTDSDVINIKQLLRDKKSYSTLAKQFNISKSTIAMIARGERWSHIR